MDPTSGPDATESWVSAISTTYIVLESRCGGGGDGRSCEIVKRSHPRTGLSLRIESRCNVVDKGSD